MKVRNIAFSGFAAVILASVCGNAMAVSLASKNYVDDGLATKASIEDFENLESTVGKKATQEALKEVADQVVINTNDIAELKAKGYITDEDLTNLQTALEGAIAEKPDASELEDLKTAVESLQTGTVDKAVVESLQTTVETITNDYAKKSELTSAEERLQAAIDAINIPSLTEYAKTADVNEALALKADKSELTDLVTSTQLTELRTALEAEIAKKQNSGDYATAKALQDVSDSLATLTGDVYTKAQVDAKIAEVAAGGEINLDGYATTSALEALTALVNDKQDKLTAGANVEIVNNTISANVDLSGLATSTELTNLQTALESAIAEKQEKGDYLTAADLTELSSAVAALESGKADASTVSSIQETIGKLGDTYASKSELTSAEERLQAAINNIDLTAYAKTADVNAALASKADKSELTTLATTEALNNLQSTLQAAINEKQAAGDYLTAADLTELSSAVAALESGKADASTVSSIQETIGKLGDTYASKSELTSAEERLQAAIDNIDLTAYAKTADLARVATTGQYADLEGKPEIPSIEGLATTDALNNLQTTLQAAINEKQAAGDYLTAADLTELSNEVAALKSGKADASTVSSIQETIGKLGDTYASKSELTSAEERLQAAINNIDLTVYAKTADVNAALLLKADKSELTGLVTSEDLANLRTALETEIAKKQNSGDYATAKALQDVSDSLATLTGDVYTKAQVDAKIAEVAAGGEINLDGYATTSALEALTALVNDKQDKLTAGTGITITGNTIAADVDTSSFIINPTNPGLGDYVLYASCTSKKCVYSLVSVDEILGSSSGGGGYDDF